MSIAMSPAWYTGGPCESSFGSYMQDADFCIYVNAQHRYGDDAKIADFTYVK